MNERNALGPRVPLLIVPLALVLLGSTCVVVGERPADITYGEESNQEALEEEMMREEVSDMER